MNAKIPEWVKPGVWGAIIGAVVIGFVAFGAGWVVTSGEAKELADARAEKAVVSALTPVCVAQFKKAEEKQVHIAALEETDSWNRGDYVEEHGWATLPGRTEPNDEVADACAEELLKVANK